MNSLEFVNLCSFQLKDTKSIKIKHKKALKLKKIKKFTSKAPLLAEPQRFPSSISDTNIQK